MQKGLFWCLAAIIFRSGPRATPADQVSGVCVAYRRVACPQEAFHVHAFAREDHHLKAGLRVVPLSCASYVPANPVFLNQPSRKDILDKLAGQAAAAAWRRAPPAKRPAPARRADPPAR